MDEVELEEVIQQLIEDKAEEIVGEELEEVESIINQIISDKKSELIDEEIEKRLKYLSIDTEDVQASYGA